MARGLLFPTRSLVIWFCVIILQTCIADQSGFPVFTSLTVQDVRETNIENVSYKKIEFNVFGENLFSEMQIMPTKTLAKKNTECKEESTKMSITMVWVNATVARYVLQYPSNDTDRIYFCLHHRTANNLGNYAWHHQGENVSVILSDSINNLSGRPEKMTANFLVRKRRSAQNETSCLEGETKVTGLKIDATEKVPTIDSTGIPILLAGTNYTIRIFGFGFTERMDVVFTRSTGDYKDPCLLPEPTSFPVIKETVLPHTAQVNVQLPYYGSYTKFYICIRETKVILDDTKDSTPYVHQGTFDYVALMSYEKAVPLWVACVIIIVCLTFSALFSGLNLGLMSLDRTELKILVNTGTPAEQKYAKIIQPVRNHGNYLLCSILLGNVFVNSIFTILLDDLTSGVVAVVCSTLAIVMFGEITPQAICSRHGLAVGAKTIYITKMVMGLTAPLAYPISKLLDCILGEEIGNVYNRERLKELVKVTTGENDLDRDEVNIVTGALELRKKTVSDVMTKIEDAFMLEYDSVLDFETVSEIMKSGYSRIPVFEGDRKNIVTTLYIKDLAFVDPDDNTPLKTLCQFYQNPCNFVFEDVKLDVMFKEFKEGNKGHMAFVHRVNSEGEGDPFYETIGLITLEDVIEELIQAEIMDETDVFTDNRSKRRRIANSAKQDFTIFAERKGENNRIRISPQLTLATYQYLSTTVDQFKPSIISETILRRLLKQDIVYHIKKNKDWRNDPGNIIYQQGKPVDYFILVLEGRVEVTVGKENLVFESGPFTYFGTQALIQTVGIAESPSTIGSLQSLNMDTLVRMTFQPDYTVRACTEVLYLRVIRSLYLAAKRATLMERSQKDSTQIDQFDDEVEKLLNEDPVGLGIFYIEANIPNKQQFLHSLEDEGSIGRVSPPPVANLQASAAPGDSNTIPYNASPRTPTYRSNISPIVPHIQKESNTTMKIQANPLEDGHIPENEEEISLINKKL